MPFLFFGALRIIVSPPEGHCERPMWASPPPSDDGESDDALRDAGVDDDTSWLEPPSRGFYVLRQAICAGRRINDVCVFFVRLSVAS